MFSSELKIDDGYQLTSSAFTKCCLKCIMICNWRQRLHYLAAQSVTGEVISSDSWLLLLFWGVTVFLYCLHAWFFRCFIYFADWFGFFVFFLSSFYTFHYLVVYSFVFICCCHLLPHLIKNAVELVKMRRRIS